MARSPKPARAVLAGALASLLAALAGSCASTGAGGGAPPDGEVLYRARCALCHPAWHPTDFTPAEWPAYVDEYWVRAGLTPAERDAVLAFLVREAGSR